MSISVVLDNTVLSNFAQVGRTDLVIRLWPQTAFTTPEVMREHISGVERGLFPGETWTELPILELTRAEEALRDALPSSLGAGERSCLAVARQREMILATDDLDARKAATRENVGTTGTIGILVLCIRQGLLTLDEGHRVLDLMIEHNYHSPVDSLEHLV